MHEIVIHRLRARDLFLISNSSSRIRTSLEVPPGARLNRRISSCRAISGLGQRRAASTRRVPALITPR